MPPDEAGGQQGRFLAIDWQHDFAAGAEVLI